MKLKLSKKFNRYDKDQVVDVEEKEAKNLLRRGVAEVVEEPVIEVKEEKKKPANKAEKKKPTTK